MRWFLFTLFALIFSNIVFGSDMTIYRWVDENNIVHFSQNQPNSSNYTQLSATKIKIKKPKTNLPTKKDLSIENKANIETSKDNEKSKCLTAQKNLKTIQDFDNIKYKTLAGNFKILSGKEKKSQLAFNKKQIELYCSN